jgi:lipopolysaccharide/colanic/teichoic acid biosynthesis glycosyltransferase
MQNEFLSTSPPYAGVKEMSDVVDSSDWGAVPADVERIKLPRDANVNFAGAPVDGAASGARPSEASDTLREVRRFVRRAFDVTCAATGLVVLSPILLMIAVAVKLEDGGPVLFSQPRVGKGFEKFQVLKFRSMIPASKDGCLLTAQGDPRITRVGRVLRKYKLDELPQLVNVVRGDMQLVGVRPQVKCFVEAFPFEYGLLLQDRPGITDLATLSFRNEEQMFHEGPLESQYIAQMLPQKLRLSLLYRQNRTFFSDLKILFCTVLGFKSVRNK